MASEPLAPQPRLVDPRGGGARQVAHDHRGQRRHGEALSARKIFAPDSAATSARIRQLRSICTASTTKQGDGTRVRSSRASRAALSAAMSMAALSAEKVDGLVHVRSSSRAAGVWRHLVVGGGRSSGGTGAGRRRTTGQRGFDARAGRPGLPDSELRRARKLDATPRAGPGSSACPCRHRGRAVPCSTPPAAARSLQDQRRADHRRHPGGIGHGLLHQASR